MSKSQKVSVVLTPEGINLFKDDIIKFLLKDGKYFICNSVKKKDYFMDMKVFLDNESQIYDLSIPLKYILYVISYDVIKDIGFKEG